MILKNFFVIYLKTYSYSFKIIILTYTLKDFFKHVKSHLPKWFFKELSIGGLYREPKGNLFGTFIFNNVVSYEKLSWTGINLCKWTGMRSEEHTSELNSHSEISYAVFRL